MNTQDNSDLWLCQFVEQQSDHYVCNKCGREVFSEDGPPPLICSVPSASLTEAPELSFATKIKNFAIAASSHISNGAKLCSDEQIENRYKICQGCVHFVNSSCNQCGCPVLRNKKFISKLSWASSECPIGKWGVEH